MKKVLALISMAILPLTAAAHGPSPQKVEKEIAIKAPPAKVWALVKDFANMPKWNPAIASEKVESKKDENGDMATYGTITLKSGGNIVQKLRSADDTDMKLKYEFIESVLPVADYNSYIVVKPGATPNDSVVTWTGRFYRVYKLNPPIPPGQDDESAVKAITGFFDTGLAGLKKAAEEPAKK